MPIHTDMSGGLLVDLSALLTSARLWVDDLRSVFTYSNMSKQDGQKLQDEVNAVDPMEVN